MKTTFLKFAAIVLSALLIMSGCSGTESEKFPEHDWSGYFVYPMEDVYSFDVDKDGNLYSAAFSSDILKVYDPYGAEIEEKTLPTQNHIAIGIKDSDIYTLSGNELYRNDEKIYEISFENMAKDLRIVGDDLYILYRDSAADLSQAPMVSPLEGWRGEKVLRIDLSDMSVSDVSCEYPVLISSTGDTLWVYGLDDNGGYVAPVNGTETGTRIPTGYYMPDSFLTIDNTGKYIASGAAEDSTLTLRLSNPADGQTNEIMPNVTVMYASGIKERDGYIYYLNSYAFSANTDKIERIRQSAYIKDNTPVKLLATEWFSYIPFGCGRTVVESRLSKEEFALTVLSQDRGFDACVLSSSQDFSKNFRDNGSFYALNDVQGVKEYVERCFPALREAVTNADGEIWALPLSMNVPCAIYHTENCKEEGFSPNGLTLEELITEAGKLYSSDPTRRDICIYASTAIPIMLRNELSGETDVLNRADLTDKLDFLKKEMSGEPFDGDVPVESNNFIYGYFGEDMLVMLAESRAKQMDFSYNGNIRAADIFEGTNPADCVFLCVNPSSDNLSATLEYITALCGYLSSKTNDFKLDDESLYSDSPYIADLLEIYRDSEIFFRIPDEILLEPVKQYLQDALSADELIAEADRKLSAYLNE
ncbi:MAG: hypothetical protein HDR72_03315 [Ruminococcaceae bacterium]|nr:hypothetical protein [Oscillospiraceae bacterium]